jgi:hypothetical protein
MFKLELPDLLVQFGFGFLPVLVGRFLRSEKISGSVSRS